MISPEVIAQYDQALAEAEAILTAMIATFQAQLDEGHSEPVVVGTFAYWMRTELHHDAVCNALAAALRLFVRAYQAQEPP